jgi:hypothetical protein
MAQIAEQLVTTFGSSGHASQATADGPHEGTSVAPAQSWWVS